MKIKKVEWHIAIRKKGKPLYEGNTRTTFFTVINNSLRYWCADPFLLKYNGLNYLFFEMYDRLKRKGVIGYRVIDKDGKLSKMHKAYEGEFHLSYPNIFFHGNDIVIVPESSAANELFYLRAVDFPNVWEKHTMIKDFMCADSTFCNFRGKKFILTSPIIKGEHSKYLCVSQIKDELHFEKINKNFVVNDKKTARMAGNCIVTEDIVIRPSQDCCLTYGSALNFSKIEEIDDGKLNEVLMKCITTADIAITNNLRYDGIHTYNANDDYEVIDLKTNEKFNFLEVIGFCINVCKKVIRCFY